MSLRGSALVPVVALAASVLAPACSSAGDAATPSGEDAMGAEGTVVSCADDPLAMAYAPDMKQAGKYGFLSFTLVRAQPAPPEMGTNTWTLAIADADGAPVTDAVFPPLPEWGAWPNGVRPYMVHHGHSASIAPTVTANGDGTYTLSNVDFFMPGLWTVTIHAVSMACADDAVFAFCIAG